MWSAIDQEVILTGHHSNPFAWEWQDYLRVKQIQLQLNTVDIFLEHLTIIKHNTGKNSLKKLKYVQTCKTYIIEDSFIS